MNREPQSWEIDGNTQVVALLGQPVAHSLSPAMHNAAFFALQLNWRYIALPVGNQGVSAAMELCRDGAFAGLNITAPHKVHAASLVNTLDNHAIKIGSINTVINDRGKLVGHNTDSAGFWTGLVQISQIQDWNGCQVLIIGAGGSTQAICHAMALGRAHAVHITARSAEKGENVVQRLRQHHAHCRWSASTLQQINRSDNMKYDIIINATPVGTGDDPISNDYQLHTDWFTALTNGVSHPGTWFVDTVYRPDVTPFCQAAQRYGLRWMSGLGMLLWQGCLAFELWTNQRAPVNVMQKALQDALRVQ